MKKAFLLLIITSFIISCNSNQENKTSDENTQQSAVVDPANLETIEISVHGMTCGGCERTVQKAVSSLPGVQEVKASHTDSVAIVTFDKTQSGFKEMKTAINDKGYEALDFKIVEK